MADSATQPDPKRPAAIQKRKEVIRRFVAELDSQVRKFWLLGRNIVVGFYISRGGKNIDLMMLPFYFLPNVIKDHEDIAFGARMMSLEQLNRVSTSFKIKPISLKIDLLEKLDESGIGSLIENIVKRYSITKTGFRAAAMIDIPDLEKYGSVEQVTLLNSLSYSINVAQQKMLGMGVNIDLARINTRRGFVIWNRDEGVTADVKLYYLLTLTTTDNALARLKGNPNTAPTIRTAFHIDSHYEYFQPEGLSPRVQNMIIGNVTEKLEIMIAHSKPNQITIGRFARPDTDKIIEEDTQYMVLNTGRFLARAQLHLDYFESMKLSGHQVTSIKNYLTGKEIGKGTYNVSLYSVGKDPTTAQLFNIKLNIYRGEADPLLIGLQDCDLADYGNMAEDFDTNLDTDPFVRPSAKVRRMNAKLNKKIAEKKTMTSAARRRRASGL